MIAGPIKDDKSNKLFNLNRKLYSVGGAFRGTTDIYANVAPSSNVKPILPRVERGTSHGCSGLQSNF